MGVGKWSLMSHIFREQVLNVLRWGQWNFYSMTKLQVRIFQASEKATNPRADYPHRITGFIFVRGVLFVIDRWTLSSGAPDARGVRVRCQCFWEREQGKEHCTQLHHGATTHYSVQSQGSIMCKKDSIHCETVARLPRLTYTERRCKIKNIKVTTSFCF